MEHLAKLAASKQAFEALTAMCEPEGVETWSATAEQHAEYLRLAQTALEGLDHLERLEARELLSEGKTHSFVPQGLLAFLRDHIAHRRKAIRLAQDKLDPKGAFWRDIQEEIGRTSGAGGLVRHTFDVGLQQVYELIDRNPDWQDDENHTFLPDTANEVLESKLINFEPDEWLNRIGELAPVRLDRPNLELPSHVRLRLQELYRNYVFGCWLSVLAVSRSILEYALLDNLQKFGVEATYPPGRDGKRREKKLSSLVEEVAVHLPQFNAKFEQLR